MLETKFLTFINGLYNIETHKIVKASYEVLSSEIEQCNKLLKSVAVYKKLNENRPTIYHVWENKELALKTYKEFLTKESRNRAEFIPSCKISMMLQLDKKGIANG